MYVQRAQSAPISPSQFSRFARISFSLSRLSGQAFAVQPRFPLFVLAIFLSVRVIAKLDQSVEERIFLLPSLARSMNLSRDYILQKI